jgi:hypothetical protein
MRHAKQDTHRIIALRNSTQPQKPKEGNKYVPCKLAS